MYMYMLSDSMHWNISCEILLLKPNAYCVLCDGCRLPVIAPF